MQAIKQDKKSLFVLLLVFLTFGLSMITLSSSALAWDGFDGSGSDGVSGSAEGSDGFSGVSGSAEGSDGLDGGAEGFDGFDGVEGSVEGDDDFYGDGLYDDDFYDDDFYDVDAFPGGFDNLGGWEGGGGGDGGSGSGPVCGNYIPESGEQCDDGNNLNGDGCSSVCQTEITVAANTAPTLSIPDKTVNEDDGFLNNLVDLFSYVVDDFTSALSMVFSIVAQTSANIISCSLDAGRFVDCATQSNQNGFSDVMVSATDESGLTTMQTFRINVNPLNDAPTVNIAKPGSKVDADEEFDFVADASDADGDALAFLLDFGDGTTETGTVAGNKIESSHSYENEGTYTITVTVYDGSSAAMDFLDVNAEGGLSDPKKIIYVGSLAFDREFAKPGDDLYLFVNYENAGTMDLKDVRTTAIIPELGIRSSAAKSEVDDNKGATEKLLLEIPEDAPAGRYWVEIVVDIDGDRRIKYRPIDII